MLRLATYVNKRLIVIRDGELLPPGAGPKRTWDMQDGNHVGIACRGDGVDVYVGRHRSIRNFTMTPQVARQLAFWLLRWWVFDTWCGVKLFLWSWSLRAIIRSQGKEQRHAIKNKSQARQVNRSSA